MSEKKLKTFIRWQGNKSRFISHILPLIPKDYNTYIEPFLGSGAILLKHKPTQFIINDLNRDNINIWKLVRDNPNKIINAFKTFGNTFKKLSKSKKIEVCKKKINNLNTSEYNDKRCIDYLLMKACSYMGNIFINNKFKFCGGLDLAISIKNNYTFMSVDNLKNIKNVSEYLNQSKGQIYNADYKKILKKAKKNDFVFLDPPYIEKKDYCFNYNKNEILDQDFINELVQQVKILDKRDVYWIMTQANTKQVRNAFANYKIKTFDVYRVVSKSYIKELIIMNY
jgi:DNA adenine methylase